MNLSFADTLYFKKENILEIILGLHRSYKSLQREIQTCCEIYQLTFNELLVLLEIRKGFNKKVDIANRIYIKKQNLNLIIKDLKEKDIIKNDGKKVVIGANLDDKKFDVAVGLALHEGSHIKLSDFTCLPEN